MVESRVPMARSLHLRIMLFIGLTISVIICALSLYYVKNLRQDYLETIEWRSATLAQSIRVHLTSRYDMFKGLADTDLMVESAYLLCKSLYYANQHMHVSFVSVLAENGRIITHNEKALWNKMVDRPELLQALQSAKITTILLDDTYHTLIPVVTGEGNVRLGTIDVGFPKDVVDRKVTRAVSNAVLLCVPLFFISFLTAWFFIRQVVTHPVDRLIEATSHIARGDLDREIDSSKTEEFQNLAESLAGMRDAIRQTMVELSRKNQEVKALIACSPVALFSVDLAGRVAIWTASAERLLGWPADEVMGRRLPTVPEGNQKQFDMLCQKAHEGGVVMGYEMPQKKRNGSVFPATLSCAPIRDSAGSIIGVMGTIEDITKRIEREHAHQKVQTQLIQAQKMESIGRLAGGVAHDYNNTLGVILGYAELLQERLAKEGNKCEELREIIKATLHSADITRQLLAFARQQTISPKRLDLNRCVENMLKMLRRLIGENIELEWLPQKNLGSVKMDMVQVDQILANFCINAKDAMDGSGKITIETRSVTVDEAYCSSHPEFHPGEFICLTVSDTGTGMDKKTQEKIFDPFFTTKGMGEGTGLGLSTVYGIVKQNNGIIDVYSELGKGTTFNIYLARYESPVEQGATVRSPLDTGKGEGILLVEDDEDILEISQQMLTSLGYRVIDTQSPAQAVALARENKDILKLLITDVILPDMNGLELSGRVQEVCPNLKTLFMSGYTADVIAHQGVLDDGVHFIQKPFSKQDLADKVRSVLDM